MILGFGLSLTRQTANNSIVIPGCHWEVQNRGNWSEMSDSWGVFTTCLGNFKYWEEQKRDWWYNQTQNWENFTNVTGSLVMIEEYSTNWDLMSSNWEVLN